MQRLGYLLLISVAITLVVIPAFAVAPFQQFTFQGLLKNSDGTLVNGQRDITLRIYNSATATAVKQGSQCIPSNFCLWQENQTNIGVTNGIFTIPAGNQTSLASRINFTTALFLEVIVRSTSNQQQNADQILSPRINLTSAPFALAASRGVGTNATTAFNVTNISAGPTLIVKGGSTTQNILNVTAGSLTSGSALVIESTSGNTATRNLVNMTNDNTAATGTTVLSLRQGSTGNILNVVNASGAETLKVSGAGVTTVTQLKVNTTGTTLKGIFTGRNTTTVFLGTNEITVTGTDGNDAATCSFQSGLLGSGKNFFVTIGNVTTNKVFVNVTYSGPASYPRAPFPLSCIVFDIP